MASRPTFLVGARAKISVEGAVVAYATDVNYSVDVAHIPIEVLGAYEVISYEPVGYRVSGTLSVVRYTSNPNTETSGKVDSTKPGNSSFSMGSTGSNAGAKAAFNPGNLLLSQTFDITVVDRRDGNNNEGQRFIKISDARFERRSAGLNAKGIMTEQYSFNGILFGDDVADTSQSFVNP